MREADTEEWEEKEELARDARGGSAEDVVPIVERRRQKMDGGVKSDHGSSHVLTCEIEIEAAPEAATLVKEVRQPSGVGPGTSGGQAAVLGMEKVTTEGVDG